VIAVFDTILLRGVKTMKEIDRIEKQIECIEPSTVVKLDALLKGVKRKQEIKETAIMLLKKYGIEYKE
jgi:hypothetical protein